MPRKWVSVSLPEILKEITEQKIEEGVLPYTSWADFVKDAVRKRLRDFGIMA